MQEAFGKFSETFIQDAAGEGSFPFIVAGQALASKSMPSHDLEKSARTTSGQRDTERSSSGTSDQQQRNQKGNVNKSQSKDIDE